MRIELSQARFDEGVGDFDIGHILFDTQAERQVKIVKFSGYAEVDEADGTEHETINVHFVGADDMSGLIAFEDLQRAVYRDRTFEPIAPDWFVDEVKGYESPAEAAAEQQREAKEKREARAMLADLKNRIIPDRPVDACTDAELMSKITGAPLIVGEEVFTCYEGNLARMANSTAKQMQKIAGIGKTRSEKIIAAFELGKRLARFHAEKDKITSPSDVAELLMSKMRYLQKEIVVVLALDTKGGVTSTGKSGEIASDLKWGKVLNETTVFEGTLNASVFHPREIFRFAIEESANSIVLCHNHPSGDPQPSQEDIRATKQLIEAGNQIGIKVLDHIVIGDGIFVSLKEEGFI
ncbi:MAG: DNA repair protein RadC [Candidatus Poribacteria bacterium]|nr:DNA repair protein RadC [Candidatus Poribacteria bacterium]